MLVYPNPVYGPGSVTFQITLVQAEPLVRVEIFTLAFRKVNEVDFNQVPEGTMTISFNLVDRSGKPLANGLYYVVINTNQGRFIAKLLVLR